MHNKSESDSPSIFFFSASPLYGVTVSYEPCPVVCVFTVAIVQSLFCHIRRHSILPSCFWPASYSISWELHSHCFPSQMALVSLLEVPIPAQSCFLNLSGNFYHFQRSSNVLVLHFIPSCHTRHPSQHLHFRHIQLPFIGAVSSPYIRDGLTTAL